MIPTPGSVSFRGSLRKHPFLHALRRWGRFVSPVAKSEEKRMFSQASLGVDLEIISWLGIISGAVQIKEYLAVISYANSTSKLKQGVGDLCPQNFCHWAWAMSGSVIKTFADESPLASNLDISFFPSFCFGVAVKGNYCSRDISKPQISNLGKNRLHSKHQVSLGKLSTSRVYLGKKSVVWPQLDIALSYIRGMHISGSIYEKISLVILRTDSGRYMTFRASYNSHR